MSTPCFYLDALGETAELKGEEARHLQKVLRMRVGDRVRLLDGQGTSGLYRVEEMCRGSVCLRRQEESYTPRPESGAIVALALSRATRRGFFMEKAVELGALGVWIWQAERSQGRLDASSAAAWRRQLVAGAKQSANPWLPELRLFEKGISELAPAAREVGNQLILPWERQEGQPMLSPKMAQAGGISIYVIGPEGGFADSELEQLFASGFVAVSLGGHVLRCETAAVLCLGIHWWASGLAAEMAGGSSP